MATPWDDPAKFQQALAGFQDNKAMLDVVSGALGDLRKDPSKLPNFLKKIYTTASPIYAGHGLMHDAVTEQQLIKNISHYSAMTEIDRAAAALFAPDNIVDMVDATVPKAPGAVAKAASKLNPILNLISGLTYSGDLNSGEDEELAARRKYNKDTFNGN